MGQQIAVRWAPATNGVLSGSYTLSHGLTPSVVTLECVRFDGEIPAVSDVVFTDSEDTLTLKDCLYSEKGSHSSGSGRTRTVTLLDRRWRWRFGAMEGRYNRIINEHPEVQLLPPDQRPAGYDAETQSARTLAEQCLDSMGEKGYDVDALPDDDFPLVEWDFCTPAQALGELCDRYHLLVAFDPDACQVMLCTKGEGLDLPPNGQVSDDISDIQPPKPKTLRGVCNYTEHEVSFDLEAVGLDTDGQVKAIADLSYKPGGGWPADHLLFSGIADTPIVDPKNPSLTTTALKLAQESVYRWYRIIPKRITNWTQPGWGVQLVSTPTLAQLLPLCKQLVQTVQVTDALGNIDVQRRPAFVTGVFLPDITLGTGIGTNTAASAMYPKNFELDEQAGIVKFSEPVIQLDGSGNISAAELELRCVVFADRYTKDKDIGGSYGVETVSCEGVTLQYRHGLDAGTGLETIVGNILDVDKAVDGILEAKAATYEIPDNGSRVYPGVWLFRLDGYIQQITWSLGPNGALTTASVNSEHALWLPQAAARRRMECGGVPRFSPASTGQLAAAAAGVAAESFAAPRHFGASNAYAGAIPAFSLVAVSAIAGRLATVTAPGADNLIGVMATGPSPIPQSGAGLCSADWPLPVVYAGAAPSVGDERGTATGSFQLTAGKKGFKVVAVDAGNGLAWVVRAGGGPNGEGGGSSSGGGGASVYLAYSGGPYSIGDVIMQIGPCDYVAGCALVHNDSGFALRFFADAVQIATVAGKGGAPGTYETVPFPRVGVPAGTAAVYMKAGNAIAEVLGDDCGDHVTWMTAG